MEKNVKGEVLENDIESTKSKQGKDSKEKYKKKKIREE